MVQAFGCVLGFEWRSSGVTTVVTGIFKQFLKEDIHEISIAWQEIYRDKK
jgi:uncharacterized protein